VIGPTLATAFLLVYPGSYRTLFALTIVPGAIAVLLIFFVPEQEDSAADATDVVSAFRRTDAIDVVSAFRRTEPPESLPPGFKRFMVVLSLFTLGNSTDAFLLLRLTDAAGSAAYVPLMWAALHIVKASVSVVGGSWSDRIGRRAVIAIGWLVYAIVYAGFAVSSGLAALVAWFMVYGFYFGFAEGTEKALIADFAPVARRGTAFGIYNAVTGLGALVASVVFGVLWRELGAATAFGTGAAIALVATALLFILVPSSDQP
jgi:MFS family permease